MTGYLVLAALFPNEEIWAPVPEFPGYEISSKARCRSYWTRIYTGNGCYSVIDPVPQVFLKGSINRRTGHLFYGLCRNRKVYSYQAGHWMLRAFVGPYPGDGYESCHKDSNPRNDDLSNLRWGTISSNCVDCVLNGTHPHAKLNPEKVVEIRRLIGQGVRNKVIAARFGVTPDQISLVKRRVAWRFVE